MKPGGESPEAMKARIDEEDRLNIEKNQRDVDELTSRLGTIDFSRPDEVLRWIARFELSSDSVGVKVNREEILAAFAEHGYTPSASRLYPVDEKQRLSMDVGKEDIAQMIVGQALNDISSGQGIHPSTGRRAKELLSRFA